VDIVIRDVMEEPKVQYLTVKGTREERFSQAVEYLNQ
jgi:hypothetical protein